MAVVISEIVTEVVVGDVPAATPGPGELGEDLVDQIVRRASERVLEILRREWDR